MTSQASSLNHIFRSVWNQALGAMVAVAEISSGGRSRSPRTSRSSAATLPAPEVPLGVLALGIALAWSCTPALANPTGALAIAGQAVVSTPSPNQLLVTTQNAPGTNRSVINWQSFSIPVGSGTYFAQPSAASTSINRVVTDNPSAIFGTLGSNGKLVLVNPSGITVGAGAVVDTAGFTASALAMSEADALSGRLRFGAGSSSTGSVSVEGSIISRNGGDIVLIAPQVNTGKDALLQASGSTILAAGQQVEITGRGLEGIVLQVQAPTDQAVNLGTLQGDAVGVFAGTLKHSGAIQANALSVEGGKVVLKALDMADVSGQIQAQKTQGQGGDIQVTADKTVLRSTASLDTSNSAGGGNIRIGGGWHGEDTGVPNAKRTVVEQGAQIQADATGNGNGGTVVVWADQATGFKGSISAKGGANGGDGGKVEVSGKQYLDFQGTVDTAAAKGKVGSLLLDPSSIVIGTVADIDSFGGGDLNAGNNPILSGQYFGYGSQITAGAVAALLNTGTNVQLQASTGNIDVNTAVTKTAGGSASLALNTGGSINYNAPVSSTAGALTISAQSGSGNITLAADMATNGGSVFISTSTGSIALNANLNAGAGSVSLTSTSNLSQNNAKAITAASLTATAVGGSVTLNGANNIASVVLNAPGGVGFNNTAASYTLGGTGTGGLTVTGTGALTVGQAVSFDSGVSLTSNGGITLSANVISAFGVSLTTTNSAINQPGGHISANGTSASAGSGDISLNASANQSGVVSLSTTGHITYVDSGNVTISALTVPVNHNLYLQATGTLTMPGGDINTGSGQLSLLSGGTLSAPGNLTGSDLLLGGTTGLTVGYNLNASGNLTLNGNSISQTAGAIHASGTTTVNGASGTVSLLQPGNDFAGAVSLTGGSVSVRDSNALVLGSSSASSLNVLTAGALTQTGSVTSGSTAFTTGAGSVALTNAGNSLGSLSVTSSAAVDVANAGAITLSAISAGTFSLQAGGGQININGLVSASAGGDAVVLRTTGHINAGYGGSVTTAAGGRWLAYLKDPGGDTFPTGLAFKQYNTVFGGTVQGAGNGVIYNNSTPATLTAALTGSATKVYDGSTAIGLAGASVGAVTPSVAGDVATVSLTGASGTLADPNVGTGKQVTVTGANASVHDANALPVYGYQLSGISGFIGIVKPAIPIISLTGERAYNGSTIVNAGIFTLSGLVNGETLTLSGSGTLFDKNAGVNKPVNLGTLSLGNGSGLASNYTFDGGTFVATITPLSITSVTGLSAANKVYDGTTKASINTSAAVFGGILSGDTLSIASASASFADKNAGTGKTVTITNLSFGGSDAQNYKFDTSTSATTTADISKANISAISGLAVANKVYDGTPSATLAAAAPTLSGAIAGDDLHLTAANASFADKNAGSGKTVSITGLALSGLDAKNYTLSAPTSASTSASISKAPITSVTGIAGISKAYDGTTIANLDTRAEALSGAIPGDSLTLLNIQSSFANKNAGANKTINLSGFTLGGADAANYSLNFSSTSTTANITPAVLQLSGIAVSDKVYDGNTVATITTANAKLGGVIGSDNVTLGGFGAAVFADKNVGANKAVSVTNLQLSGTDASNYALTGSVAAGSANITVRPQATWVGGSSSLWSDAANWADKAIPDGSNVLAVSIAAGAGSIIFDAATPATSLQSFSSARPLVVSGSALNVASALNLGSYSQSAGTLTGTAGMNVSSSFSQTGGSITLGGPLVATQATGNLQVGSITAAAITLSAPAGSISQGAGLSTASLTTSSATGTSLTASGNKVGSFKADNTGTGDISLVNTGVLNIVGINNAGGNVTLNNTGGVVTGDQLVKASGKVAITAHSPLTIGSGGVQAGGDITLTAGTSAGQDDLTINGPVSSANGSVTLTAGDNLLQNANVSAPLGAVTANAAGLISGSGVSTGKEVNYTSNGVTVPPPGTASVTVIQTLVTTFTDSFKEQSGTSADTVGQGATDPASNKDKKNKDDLVVADSSLCK